MAHVKTTIDLPEDLHRKVKAKSALEGRPMRDVAIELFREWVEESPGAQREAVAVSAYDLMRDMCGAWDSGIPDLASNREHLEGLGRDSLGHS